MLKHEQEQQIERQGIWNDSTQKLIYPSFIPWNWLKIPWQGLIYFLNYAEYDGLCL